VEWGNSIIRAGFHVEIRNSCHQHVIQCNSGTLKRRQNEMKQTQQK